MREAISHNQPRQFLGGAGVLSRGAQRKSRRDCFGRGKGESFQDFHAKTRIGTNL